MLIADYKKDTDIEGYGLKLRFGPSSDGYGSDGYGRSKRRKKKKRGFFKKVGRFITRAVPAAVGGFLVGGPVGAAVGVSTGFIGGKNKPLKRLMYGVGAGGTLAAATPALIKAFPNSQLVANMSGSVYSSPISSSIARLTTRSAVQTASAVNRIGATTQQNKQAAAMRMAEKQYSPETTEQYLTEGEGGMPPQNVSYNPQTGQLTTTQDFLLQTLKAGTAMYQAAQHSKHAQANVDYLMNEGYNPEDAYKYATHPAVQRYLDAGYSPEESIQMSGIDKPRFDIKKYLPYILGGAGIIVVLIMLRKPSQPLPYYPPPQFHPYYQPPMQPYPYYQPPQQPPK